MSSPAKTGDPVLPVARFGYDCEDYVYWMPAFAGMTAGVDSMMKSTLAAIALWLLAPCWLSAARAHPRRQAFAHLEPAGSHHQPAGRRRRHLGQGGIASAERRLHALHPGHLA